VAINRWIINPTIADGSEMKNIGKNRNAVETAMTSAVEAMNGSSRDFSCRAAAAT
jgi:hypothetical protein